MYTIQVNNYLLQHEVSDSLPADAGCHLIKLKEGHVAIDFVIIERLAGKLFLVQVSMHETDRVLPIADGVLPIAHHLVYA